MKELIHKFSGKTIRLNRFGIISDTVPFAYDYFASELPEETTSKIADCFSGRLEDPVLDRLEKTRRMDIGAFHSGKPLFAFCKENFIRASTASCRKSSVRMIPTKPFFTYLTTAKPRCKKICFLEKCSYRVMQTG